MPRRRNKKRMALKITKATLEEFLFPNTDIEISHIKFKPEIDMIYIFMNNVGSETMDGQAVAQYEFDRALKEIKKRIEECQLDQD